MALLRFKRSAVPAKVPTLADLSLGELAINTFDGKIYIRRDNGTASIVEVGGGSGVLSFNTRTGAVTLTSGDVTGALGYTPANRAGDTFTGPVSATSITSGLGAVGTPSYTFTGDTNTGMWSPAADTLAFSTAGAERVRVTSGGDVLVGAVTQSFSSKTEITSGSANLLALYNTVSNGGAKLWLLDGNSSAAIGNVGPNLLFYTAGNSSERMRIDSSGNVGIGVSAPGSALQVNGNVRVSNGSGFFTANSLIRSIQAMSGGANQFVSSSIDFYTAAFSDNGQIALTTGGTERMRIDGNTGNVGIGTASPAVPLEVAGNIRSLGLFQRSDNSGLTLSGGTTFNTGGASIALRGVSSGFNAHGMEFYAGGSERMRIDASGNVGIGTSSPQGRLDVTSSVNGEFIASVFRNTNAGAAAFTSIHIGNDVSQAASTIRVNANANSTNPNALRISNNVSGITSNIIFATNGDTERMCIDSSGNVGIGSTDPGGWRLRLNKADAQHLNLFNTAGNGVRINMSDQSWQAEIEQNAGNLLFKAGGTTERMRINNSGQFLVGTTSGGRTVCINAADNWIRQSNPTRSWLIGPSNGANYLIYDETGGATRLTIETNGVVTASGDFRAPIFYDSNNSAFYVDPSGTSLLNNLTVGSGQTASSIVMGDTDEGGRFIHCNSNRIGFLTQAGGWGSYCIDDGAWFSDTAMYSPIYYDSQDTAFYLNPNGETRLNTLKVAGETQYPGSINGDWEGGYYHFNPAQNTPGGTWGHAEIIRLDGTWNVQTFWPTSNSNEIWNRRRNNGTYSAWRRSLLEDEWIGSKYFSSNGDIYGTTYYDSNNTFFYLNLDGYSQVNGFGSVNGSAGVGMSIMGNPSNGAIMSFHRAGAFAFNMGLDSDNVFRIGGWSMAASRLQMDLNGNLTMAGNVTAFSDIRLKKDIETIEGALTLVSKMRGVRFTRIENEERNVGVIAQEMLEVCPEVVQQGVGDDDTLSVAYGNLVGVLIEAIKELTARVAELEGK